MKTTLLVAAIASATVLTGCQSAPAQKFNEGIHKFNNGVKSAFGKKADETKQEAKQEIREVTEKAKQHADQKAHEEAKKMHSHPHGHHHGHHGKEGYHQKMGGLVTKDGKPAPTYEHKDGDKKDVHHGFDPNHVHRYMCKQGATVSAVYNPHNETAKVTVYAPVWKLNNQTIDMTLAPSASGSRYINDKNPKTTYEWHTKGEIGVISITTGGKTLDINCEGEPMPANHPTYKK